MPGPAWPGAWEPLATSHPTCMLQPCSLPRRGTECFPRPSSSAAPAAALRTHTCPLPPSTTMWCLQLVNPLAIALPGSLPLHQYLQKTQTLPPLSTEVACQGHICSPLLTTRPSSPQCSIYMKQGQDKLPLNLTRMWDLYVEFNPSKMQMDVV